MNIHIEPHFNKETNLDENEIEEVKEKKWEKGGSSKDT